MQKTFYNKANLNTLASLAATVLAIFISTIITPIIIFSLGAENWARYAFFLLYVAFLQFIEASLQSYSLQANATANSENSKYDWLRDRNVKIAMLIFVLLGGIFIFLNYTFLNFNDFTLKHLLTLAILNIYPRAITAILRGNLLGKNSQVKYYLITSIFNIGRPLFLLILIISKNIESVVFLATAYVFFNFVEMITLFDPKLLKKQFQKYDENHTYLPQSLLASIVFSNLLSTLATNIDKILAYIHLSLKVLSSYTFAAQISLLLNIFINSVVSSFTPKFRELFLKNQILKIKEDFLKLSALNNFFILSSASIFIFNYEILLSTLSTKVNTKELIFLFKYLAGGIFFSSNLWLPGAISTSLGKPNFSVMTNGIFVVTYTLLYYIIRCDTTNSIFATSMFFSSIFTTSIGILYFKYKIFEFDLLEFLYKCFIIPISSIFATYIMPITFIKLNYLNNYFVLTYTFLWSLTIISLGFILRTKLTPKNN